MNLHSRLPYQDADSSTRYAHSTAPGIASPRSRSTRPTTKHTSTAEQRGEIPNIVIYGETGVGKSSVINLIAGQKLAHTSNDVLGCTFQQQQHMISLDGMPCALWDTTGLDEGTEGTVPARQAESNLRELMQGLARSEGIHLIIYCIRGARLTKALKRNYDLFYVTAFRKKVPVALVVTGLEYQQGEMETWWNENEAEMRRYRMWFDAHACVTTVGANSEDGAVIQQRRSDSQRRLRELVVRYAKLPAWKADPSFVSRVLPEFRTVFHRTSSTGNPGTATTIRKVIVCDLAEDTLVEFSPGLTPGWEKYAAQIGDGRYEFVRMNGHALQTPTSRMLEDIGGGAGLLIFYTSTLLSSHIPPTDVDALRTFYDIAGGQMCPVIVVLRGCDEGVARACRIDIASRHNNIQARFVSLPSTVDSSDVQARLGGMIERLCIERVEVKISRFNKIYTAGKQLLACQRHS